MSTSSHSTRLQVVLQAKEYRTLKTVARQQGMSLGEWVRQVLRRAAQGWSQQPATKKMRAIREAAQYQFPTADIDRMLAEIERGYLTDDLR